MLWVENSLVLDLAVATVLKSSLIMLEVLLAKALSSLGIVAESSARSTTERVAFCPGTCFAQESMKSSTISFPSCTVGMDVLLERLVSQSV